MMSFILSVLIACSFTSHNESLELQKEYFITQQQLVDGEGESEKKME